MTKRVCEHPGCERPHGAKGLCRPHYERKRQGRPLDPQIRYKPNGAKCTAEWCERLGVIHHMCEPHHRKWRQQNHAARFEKREGMKQHGPGLCLLLR